MATELRFHRDLKMCQKLFADKLAPVIGSELTSQLFLNVGELISISGQIAEALKSRPPGIPSFVCTCFTTAASKFDEKPVKILQIC